VAGALVRTKVFLRKKFDKETNVADYIGWYANNNRHICTIMKYYPIGDFDVHILKYKTGAMSEKTAMGFLSQILNALITIHRLKIVHRDVRPKNILVSKCKGQIILKLADFGVASFLDDKGLSITPIRHLYAFNSGYMAPEVANHNGKDRVTHTADYWSVGVILYRMLTGKLPFHSDERRKSAAGLADSSPPILISDKLEKLLKEDKDAKLPDVEGRVISQTMDARIKQLLVKRE